MDKTSGVVRRCYNLLNRFHPAQLIHESWVSRVMVSPEWTNMVSQKLDEVYTNTTNSGSILANPDELTAQHICYYKAIDWSASNIATILHMGDSARFTWCFALLESNSFAISRALRWTCRLCVRWPKSRQTLPSSISLKVSGASETEIRCQKIILFSTCFQWNVGMQNSCNNNSSLWPVSHNKDIVSWWFDLQTCRKLHTAKHNNRHHEHKLAPLCFLELGI